MMPELCEGNGRANFATCTNIHGGIMTTTADENFNDWLRDAHAMEKQAEQMLTAQAERLEHYPELRARIVQHIDETRWQHGILDEILARRGTDNSILKDIGGRLAAFGQAVGGMAASDEVVKGAMAGYVFENVEISSYTALIAAAKSVGDAATQAQLEQILEQEKAMAAWLLDHLPQITQAFLARSATPGVEAKK
jgi:ferritin-like metal-binding protein YciE